MALHPSNRHARIYHDLSVLLGAGLPILRALDTVRKGTTLGTAAGLRDIRKRISQGHSIAEAMEAQKNLFAEFDRHIIGAAETSGRLDECLGMLAEWYTFQDRMTRRCLSGLILPMITLHIGAFVFPLPRLVLGQIDSGGYIMSVLFWLMVFHIPVVTIWLVYRYTPKQGPLRFFFDHAFLRVPVLATGLRELGITRHSRAFNMLYKSGVPIIRALEEATYATGNLAVSAMFARCPSKAREGEMASEGFTRKVPVEYHDLWRVGEESGELDRTVDKVAEISADRADLYLTQFSSWLPKIMYGLVMAVLAYMVFQLASGYRDTIMQFINY